MPQRNITYHKLNTLQSLDQRIANTQLPKNQKSDLMSEVNKTKERIKVNEILFWKNLHVLMIKVCYTKHFRKYI